MDTITNILLIFFTLCALVGLLILITYSWKRFRKIPRHISLDRHGKNPVLSPQMHREWEINGTFNPAAVLDDDGLVHLLYRSLGEDGVSRLGYAVSKDGLHFEERSAYPVFNPTRGFDLPDKHDNYGPREYNPSFYTSGGGWGGCEDPRMVRIDGKVYMNYIAFGGWDSVRIALTSIKLDDLKKGKFNWKRSVHISPPGQVNKNWVIFPEKINGKYAILHSLSPDILIDYVDSLDGFYGTNFIHGSKPPKGGRKGFWDNWVRGAGPPPLKTEIGWLLLYHAMDKNDPNKYKVGAMILDNNDPTKILFRAPVPILSPEMPYENDGKPGVVYASGAVIKDGDLLVYYGGGDKHVCIAKTPLQDLLNWLKEHSA